MSDWADMACDEYERMHGGRNSVSTDACERHEIVSEMLRDAACELGVVKHKMHRRCDENGYYDWYEVAVGARTVGLVIETETDAVRCKIRHDVDARWFRLDADECETVEECVALLREELS